MSAIPGDVDADRGPPMAIPLRHFVVGLGLLAAGSLVGVARALGVGGFGGALAHAHLLVAGWVCVTIMGAMVQFVPVWSNVALHSRRLATAQLWLVTAGVGGMAGAFLAGHLGWVHAFGGLAVLGFWVFVYNVGRTLLAARPWDVTERHFAIALGWFVVVPALGFTLAMDYAFPVVAPLPVTRVGLLGAHATLAVFGAVLTTVVGALYQLATMFTQTEVHGIGRHLQRVETVAYPVGVAALAAGRLLVTPLVARVGAVLVAAGLLAVAAILARRLRETRVEWTPMLRRYAVVAVALAAWTPLAARAWLADPLAPDALFGGPAATHLLLFGVIGFVVAGTLYHVVPFIVWVHRYSDRLGFESVPMIDDLYDDRIATADFVALSLGVAGIVVAEATGIGRLFPVAGAVATLGFLLFAANLLSVVREHGPHSLAGVLVTRLADDESASAEGTGPSEGPDGGEKPAD
jgi:hypothetical protein